MICFNFFADIMHYYSFECILIHKVRASLHSHKVRLQHIDSLMQRYIFCRTRRLGYNTTHLYSYVVRDATFVCTQLHSSQETRFYSLSFWYLLSIFQSAIFIPDYIYSLVMLLYNFAHGKRMLYNTCNTARQKIAHNFAMWCKINHTTPNNYLLL